MTTADAVAREAAWLAASADGLPALMKSAGGPFDVVQAYWPRTPHHRQSGVYVLRHSLHESRLSNQRKLDHYEFRLKLWWPVGSTTTASGIAENEQAAFDAAIDLVVQRVRGYVADHTHGGRFLAVAEAPEHTRIAVHFHDPEATATASPACLRAEVTYPADDRDITA